MGKNNRSVNGKVQGNKNKVKIPKNKKNKGKTAIHPSIVSGPYIPNGLRQSPI